MWAAKSERERERERDTQREREREIERERCTRFCGYLESFIEVGLDKMSCHSVEDDGQWIEGVLETQNVHPLFLRC